MTPPPDGVTTAEGVTATGGITQAQVTGICNNLMNGYINSGVDAQGIIVGASPFTFVNDKGGPVLITVSGGTVLTISYRRNSTTILVGLLAGVFTLLPGDSLIITYLVPPTMFWVRF